MRKVCLLLALALSFQSSSSFAQGNSIGAGIALQLDDNLSASYVNLGDVYNDLQFPFTFEAWVFLTDVNFYDMGIFCSDNAFGTYCGCYIKLVNNTVSAEFGDGKGATLADIEGIKTIAAVSLFTWTHIAVVCNAANNVSIYFNGVPQEVEPTTGTANIKEIQHSSAHAVIGEFSDGAENTFFSGQLDEMRLWNVARKPEHIQTHMCNKITKIRDGLIGYWTADESYSSTTLEDYSGNNINGTFIGNIMRVNSGAPIGDISTYLYQNGWKGTKVSLKDSASGDKLTISHIRNNPLGVHIYEILSKPYSTKDLDQTPDFYFGVFAVKNFAPPAYNIVYAYNNTDGVITDKNESSAQLFTNTNGAESDWRDFSATNNTTAHNLQVIDAACCGEYILNVPPGPPERVTSAAASNQLNIFPNPVNDKLFFTLDEQSSAVQTIIVSDILGKEKMVVQAALFDWSSGIDVSKLPNGIYFLQAITTYGRKIGRFTVSH